MADVFLSYKSEDRPHAERIARALEGEGFTVWWDPALETGQDYQQVIDENLRHALLVVVLWSSLSTQSRWVRSEATIGDRYGALAPVMIEQCDRPVAFELVQTADLSRWTGDTQDAAWRDFVADVRSKVDQRRTARADPKAGPAPDATAIETVFWDSVKASTDPQDFHAYIARYPRGHFTPLAQNRLRALKRGASRAKPRGGGPWMAIVGAALVAAVAIGVVIGNPLRLLPSPLEKTGQLDAAVLEGRWEGYIARDYSSPAGRTVAQFGLDGEGHPSAVVSYQDEGCSGTWSFVRRTEDRQSWVLQESLSGGECINGAFVEVTLLPNNHLSVARRQSAIDSGSPPGELMRPGVEYLQGRWEGSVLLEAGIVQPYSVVAVFAATDAEHPNATVSYPGIDCAGAWGFVRRQGDQRTWVLQESIYVAPVGSCVSGALVELTPLPNGHLSFAWRRSAEEQISVRGELVPQ